MPENIRWVVVYNSGARRYHNRKNEWTEEGCKWSEINMMTRQTISTDFIVLISFNLRPLKNSAQYFVAIVIIFVVIQDFN